MLAQQAAVEAAHVTQHTRGIASTNAKGATFDCTMEPAMIPAPSPITTPGINRVLAPIATKRPIRTGAVRNPTRCAAGTSR